MTLKKLLANLLLATVLPALGHAQTVDICGRTPQVRDAIMGDLGAEDCAAVDSAQMAELRLFIFSQSGLTTLQAGDFDGLTNLRDLRLNRNWLEALPAGVFNGLNSLRTLRLSHNQLTILPAGVFSGLTNLRTLSLSHNQLATLPAGVFNGLTRLEELRLSYNELTALPAGVFDGLTNLQHLWLNDNQLATLPAGVFDSLTNLSTLELTANHLVGLSRNDSLFAKLPSGVDLELDFQTEAPDGLEPPATRLAAAVPLLVSASNPDRQGFVRIINESGESGMVRIFAVDDAGTGADPIEIALGAHQAFHFNADDLENGNAAKGIEAVGRPGRGDWRLDLESALNVRALAYVRTNDGFLTAMHDVLPRDAGGWLVVPTFNPASNRTRVSRLRLANTGATAASVRIEGFDDQGTLAGPVTFTLVAGESRTLSALDLEEGAQGLTGRLGDGTGKWYLLLGGAGSSVFGMSLLDSASGHLSNISTMANSISTRDISINVPLLVSASDAIRQGFVRILNYSKEPGMVRIHAFDDTGTAADPIEISLDASLAFHFNAGDLENGNAAKGIEGIGRPTRGDWRLDVGPLPDFWALAYVRTNDGFLTAMHDVLQRDAQGRLLVPTFNPASNRTRASRLRLANTGATAASVSIEGVDDQGTTAGPVTLTLAGGESRTLSALDLEEGAQGLAGTLGDGAGKWRFFITADRSVVGVSLLDSTSGHLSNISTMGTALKRRGR